MLNVTWNGYNTASVTAREDSIKQMITSRGQKINFYLTKRNSKNEKFKIINKTDANFPESPVLNGEFLN